MHRGRNVNALSVAGYGQLYDMKNHQRYVRIADHRKHRRGRSMLVDRGPQASSVKA